MSEKLKHIKIVLVGFRVGVENSVYYRKLETPSDPLLGKHLNIAFHDKNCDFVSIRKIDISQPSEEAAKHS